MKTKMGDAAEKFVLEAIPPGDGLPRLRASLPKARLLLERAEWSRFKNKDMAALLSELKDAIYDAEDLLRALDDKELRHKMEDAGRGRAGRLISSSLRVARSWLMGDNTRIKETLSKLDMAVVEIEGALNLLDLNAAPVQFMPETTSVLGAPEVFGRDQERDELIEMLGVTIGRENQQDELIDRLGVPLTWDGRSSAMTGRKRAAPGAGVASTFRGCKRLKGQDSMEKPAAETKLGAGNGNVSVLAIVGLGGVGKTTLAQFVYNDAMVKSHFNVRIWVCISDLFDKRRITREILESITRKEFSSSASLNVLQEELYALIDSKKLLLVLDDVWPSAIDNWDAFSAPLRHGLDGSMILVTTRSLEVAKFVTTIEPLQLEGLPTDIFWEFFKKCAFGKENPGSYPQLQGIGKSIAGRLCGSSLAAKTLGRMLNKDLTEQHWRTIEGSELWELPHRENEILPALQLSYLYLPHRLKRCFAFCSMFPKDYSFERDEIVDIWVAQGFVASTGSMRLEDIGSAYLDDLRSRFLFQIDPKFPGRSRYVMHDLIHDMARSVSVDECFLMQDARNQNQRQIPPTVRHMSIQVNNEDLSRMAELHHLNKLRSLRFGPRIEVEVPWFNQLSNILFFSLKGCKLVKLPEVICEMNSLRFLDISCTRVRELPEKFWGLYNLNFFYAGDSRLQKIHPDIVKLINLRSLALTAEASESLSKTNGLGNLSSLHNLSCFTVARENGRRVGELKGMNQLDGTLTIKCLSEVESMEEAAEARLVDKQHLKELVLQWGEQENWRSRNCHGVLEGLHPPPRIERLKIEGFRVEIPPIWLKPESLLTLRYLELFKCLNLKYVPIQFPFLEQLVLFSVDVEALTAFADDTPAGSTGNYEMQLESNHSSIAYPPLTCFTKISIMTCRWLIHLEQLSPDYLPFIKSIEIDQCPNLVSLPIHKFWGFVHLQDLKIHSLEHITCPDKLVLPPSLRRLSISKCPPLEKLLSGCLESFTSLTLLHLKDCNNVESIPLSSMHTGILQYLVLQHCSELSSIGTLDAVRHIQYVDILDCPKLLQVQQPFQKKCTNADGAKELKFITH